MGAMGYRHVIKYTLFLFVFVSCIFSVPNMSWAEDNQTRNLKSQARQYYWGIGVTQDYEKAFALYLRAAELGDAEAQYISGAMYQVGQGTEQNIPKSFKLLYGAAQKGKSTVDSELLIAQAFLLGTAVPKNVAMAVDWYTKAAEKGSTEAQNELGFLYYSGRDVEQDYKKASSYFTKAAYANHSVAQYNLGISYYTGFGQEIDLVKAYAWFSLAAKNGHNAALSTREKLEISLTEEEKVEAQLLSVQLNEEIEAEAAKKDSE